jgi:hypothetical protein
MLLDPSRGWALSPAIDDVLAAWPEATRDHVSSETHCSAVELRTGVHAPESSTRTASSRRATGSTRSSSTQCAAAPSRSARWRASSWAPASRTRSRSAARSSSRCSRTSSTTPGPARQRELAARDGLEGLVADLAIDFNGRVDRIERGVVETRFAPSPRGDGRPRVRDELSVCLKPAR